MSAMPPPNTITLAAAAEATMVSWGVQRERVKEVVTFPRSASRRARSMVLAGFLATTRSNSRIACGTLPCRS
jgi:hypothetical protein